MQQESDAMKDKDGIETIDQQTRSGGFFIA